MILRVKSSAAGDSVCADRRRLLLADLIPIWSATDAGAAAVPDGDKGPLMSSDHLHPFRRGGSSCSDSRLPATYSSWMRTNCYDQTRMPLSVIEGALSTHPVVASDGSYCVNPLYDADVRSLRPADPRAAVAKLAQLRPAARERRPPQTPSKLKRLRT